MSRTSQMLQPIATVFVCYVWIFALSACAPVLALNVQADLTKVQYNASKEVALPADGAFSVGADKSGRGTELKVTQDGKGPNSSSLKLTLQELLTSTGQVIVKRQTGEQDDFASCSTDLIDTDFTEPVGCRYGEEDFRLCVVGQFKTSRCIKDKDDYCEFCPDNTFMSDNNNCTTCRPCTQCGPNEQIAIECTIHEDTVCEPRSPSTVPHSSCPPCPVTQVITVSEITHKSTVQPDITSVLETSPSETYSPSPISACPECKCNCSDSCKNDPDFILAPACPERITLYVLAGVLVFFITVMLFLLVWGSCKYLDLEREKYHLAEENTKLKLKYEQKGTPVIQEKSNGNATTPAGYEQVPQEDIEMKELVNLDQSGTSGNTSRIPLLPGDATAEETMPVGGDTKEHVVVKLPQTSPTDEPLSLSSMDEPKLSSTLNDEEHPSMIPLLTEEDEEAENTSSAGVDPPYDRPDMSRKTKSVKGRIESTDGKPNDPPPLPQRNKGLQRSRTVGSSQHQDPSSFTVIADVHNSGEDGYSSLDHTGRFENTAFEPSMSLATLPSQARVGHMNPPEDTAGRTNSHTSEAEPAEIQPFLPQVSEQPSKTDQKNHKKSGIRRFFSGSGKKKSKSDTKQKPQNSNDVTTSQLSPGASSQTVQTPMKEPVNIEDLYAKVDKNRKKTPPATPSADSKDKPTGLRVNTKSPEDNPDDPASSSSIASPISTDPLSSDTPSVGISPTSDLPDGRVALPQTDVNDNEQKPDAEKASASGDVSMQSIKPKTSGNDVSGDSQQAGANSRTGHDVLATSHRNREENADVSHPNRSLPSKHIDPQSSETSSKKDASAASHMASGDSEHAESKNASLKIPKEKMASDEDLDTVASHLTPDDLLALYRHLKLTDAQVQQAEYNCRSDRIREKAICVLQLWRQIKGRKATCSAIITALRSSQNNEKADLLEGVLISSADSKSDIRESYI